MLAQSRDKRYFTRHKTALRGHVRVKEFQLPYSFLNLSLGGATIQFALPIAVGTPVELEIRDHPPLPARIVWVKNDRIGLQFTINPQKVRWFLGGLGASLPSELSDRASEDA